jgi:hypothetical protein
MRITRLRVVLLAVVISLVAGCGYGGWWIYDHTRTRDLTVLNRSSAPVQVTVEPSDIEGAQCIAPPGGSCSVKGGAFAANVRFGVFGKPDVGCAWREANSHHPLVVTDDGPDCKHLSPYY